MILQRTSCVYKSRNRNVVTKDYKNIIEDNKYYLKYDNVIIVVSEEEKKNIYPNFNIITSFTLYNRYNWKFRSNQLHEMVKKFDNTIKKKRNIDYCKILLQRDKIIKLFPFIKINLSLKGLNIEIIEKILTYV